MLQTLSLSLSPSLAPPSCQVEKEYEETHLTEAERRGHMPKEPPVLPGPHAAMPAMVAPPPLALESRAGILDDPSTLQRHHSHTLMQLRRRATPTVGVADSCTASNGNNNNNDTAPEQHNSSNESNNGAAVNKDDNALHPPSPPSSEASSTALMYTLQDHIAYFFFRIQRELEAVNAFFENEMAVLNKRLEEMGNRLPVIREAAASGLRHKDLHVLMDASRVVIDDLRDLDAFATVNVGFFTFFLVFFCTFGSCPLGGSGVI